MHVHLICVIKFYLLLWKASPQYSSIKMNPGEARNLCRPRDPMPLYPVCIISQFLAASRSENDFINTLGHFLPLDGICWFYGNSTTVRSRPKVTMWTLIGSHTINTQPSACSDDRKCPNSPLAPTDFGTQSIWWRGYYRHSCLVKL